MKINLIKVATLAALTTVVGVGVVENNVLADDTTSENTNNQPVQQNQVTVSNSAQQPSAYTSALYSASLSTQNVQYVNFPQGYSLDTLRGINNSTSANNFQSSTIAGMSMNNYQSNANAAKENININNLSPEQTIEMNQYAVGLVNQARSEFGLEPFQLDDGTIDVVREKALQYQSKNESIMTGSWHDEDILQNDSENISAQQIYNDNIVGLVARPFAEAKGSDFINSNQVPLFNVNTIDDLRAMIFYGFTGMLFNDASDNFGHAQNFLTNPQSINTLAVYPSILRGIGTGTYGDGSHFNFNLLNADIHYIWAAPAVINNSKPSRVGQLTGWQEDNNNVWRYYKNGQIQTGWQWINSHWYYLANGTGNMETGIKNINNSVYYFDQNGVMQTGWQKVNNNWYFFQNNGAALTGWQFINGNWYFFNGQGEADVNWQTINGRRYYFDPTNAWAVRGFQMLNNNWYYFDPTNAWMNTGWQWINGYWYYLDPTTGQMESGLQNINGQRYYLTTQHNGLFGAMMTGWQKINGSWYYFDNSGVALIGWQQINGHYYHFKNNGEADTGDVYLINNGQRRLYHFDETNAWLLN